MLDLSRRADDRALAIALDRLRVAAERRDQRRRHFQAERFQIIGKADDILDVATGERVSYDREDRGAPIGDRRDGTALVENLLDDGSTRLRSSTDGMACLLFVAKEWGAAGDFVEVRLAPDKARPFAQAKRGGLDRAGAAPKLGFDRARRKRNVDFFARERADVYGDEPIAEIALRIDIAGRRAKNGRMARNIDRIGDERGGGVGDRGRGREQR